jgi:hypothetical protein
MRTSRKGGCTICDVWDAGVATTFIALLGAEDGEFFVGRDENILQDFGRRGASVSIGVEVGKRVTPSTMTQLVHDKDQHIERM